MNIQFNRTNPAIASFNAGQQIDDQRRAQEEAAFRQRYQDERAAGVDTALRTGIGAMYARPPAAAAPAAIANPEPMPPHAPTEVQTPAPMPAATFPNTGGDDVVVPGSVAAANAMPTTPPAPAIASMTAQAPAPAAPAPAAAQPQGSRYQPLMESLAKTPGGGAAMMQAHQQASLEDQRKQAAEIQAIRALHNAEPNVAEAIARQFGINIPPEVIRDRKFQHEMAELGKSLKGIGVNDDNAAMQITRQYLEGRKNGMSAQDAWTNALAGVKVAPKQTGVNSVYDSNRGVFVDRPNEENPNGVVRQPPGMPSRNYNPNSGAGGGTSKQQQYAEWRIKTLVQGGMSEQQAGAIVAGRAPQVSEKNVADMARALLKLTDPDGNRLYPNLNASLKAARDALGGGAGQPGRGSAPARAQPPTRNANGWKLHIDGNGNRAYLGPNNEIEEVQ